MSREPLPLAFRSADGPLDGETLCLEAGASVLVLTSCLIDLGLQLRAAYLGVERVDEFLIAESAVIGGEPGDLRHRRIEAPAGALAEKRRIFLYDHLQALQDLAGRRGYDLAFDGIEDAVVLLDPHAPRASN